MPTKEELQADSAGDVPHDLSDEIAGDWKPWPTGYEPATPGERRMWRAFATVRDDQNSALNPRSVARRAGLSPTPIAYEGGRFGVLRAALLAKMEERRPADPGQPAPRSKEEIEAADQAHRETRITYWQGIAQKTDSILGEFEARAIRAEAKSSRAVAVLRRVLEDIKAGRWVRADPDATAIADLVAELGPPSKLPDQVNDADVE